MTRRGFTLHELLVALVVTALVCAMASAAAVSQLRFFRGAGELVALRTQLDQAASVSAAVLRDVAHAGDIVAALDSAFDAHVTIGVAHTCEPGAGTLVVPGHTGAAGNVLAAYTEPPDVSDAAFVAVEDSLGVMWVALSVAAPPVPAGPCVAFPSVASTWRVALQQGLPVAGSSSVRFTRRTRLSLYRASDNLWYLGLRDWNGALARFNTIQPVAGPLRPYSADPARTGLLFEYRDSLGALLSAPVPATRVASIALLVRGESVRPVRTAGLHSAAAPVYADSIAVAVTLRNRP